MTRPKGIPERLLIAIGGNATHPEDMAGSSGEQKSVAERTAASLLPLLRHVPELVVTHGNGPVVGKIMMRQMLTMDRIPPMSLDICVAHSQGGIGYLLMQAMENALREAGDRRHVAALLTQVEVDPDDPAFDAPSKFVGPFFTEDEARRIEAELGWLMREDSGRGWRHVVPSPVPRHICDISRVDDLVKRGTVVIAAGGGGIPVVRQGATRVRAGVAAVIDKDLSSARMANVLGIDTMMILTAVSRVAIDFGTPRQSDLTEIRVDDLKRLRDAGQFPPGSMGPKVDAAIRFVEGGGKRAVIGHLDEAMAALGGDAGTHVLP
ncbi:carbamate kinase [Palleronia sediminis]|uniref:Carbamate kinase n=1 Tax=Palleronia sediminis TaxID=2547833 RepID=A0A4R6AFQ1_9RHOB|nr:carbamate kinase [Palleronia sediminis]TDL81258.1 carbamate kinase [Palleronia sediminis]